MRRKIICATLYLIVLYAVYRLDFGSSVRLAPRYVTTYSYSIMRRDKLLAKVRRNPAGLSFMDLETLLEQCGWILKRQTGSHRIWKAPGGTVIPIQSTNGKAKEYQVRQILRIMENGDA